MRQQKDGKVKRTAAENKKISNKKRDYGIQNRREQEEIKQWQGKNELAVTGKKLSKRNHRNENHRRNNK